MTRFFGSKNLFVVWFLDPPTFQFFTIYKLSLPDTIPYFKHKTNKILKNFEKAAKMGVGMVIWPLIVT